MLLKKVIDRNIHFLYISSCGEMRDCVSPEYVFEVLLKFYLIFEIQKGIHVFFHDHHKGTVRSKPGSDVNGA